MNHRLIITALACTLFATSFACGEDRVASPPKVVCFGDSITKRGYSEILAKLLGVEAINAGVAGNSSAQALRRLSRDVLVHQPDVVVIFFGTNDLRADADRVYVPVPKYKDNLETIIEQCRKQGSRVVLCTLPPIEHEAFFTRHQRGPFDALGGLAKVIETYREAARQVASARKTSLVDLNGLLAREPEWLSKDGVHPSEDGNAIIAKHIAKAVAPLLGGNPTRERVAEFTQTTGTRSHVGLPNEDQDEADIIIYGATSAGVVAAVQAARMNKSVLLVEPHDHVGGLTTGGLGATDIGNKDVIGGLSREFYQRVAKHYQQDSSWNQETREEFFASRSKRTKLTEVMGENATMWTFEPSVAQAIFAEMLQEVGVQVHRQQKLKAVVKSGSRITQIETEDGRIYRARVFIDATYEGDLMAKAGVKYRVGREANAEFDETLNGIRDKTPKNQVYGSINPYVVPGDPSSGLISLIQRGDGGTPGDGDHRVQAYNFRLCFTDVAENRGNLEAPPGYDPARYELAARRVEKIVAVGAEPHIKQFCNPVWMPNRKTDINNSQGISTDFIGGNYDYPDGDFAMREKIWKAHEDYVKGFWYFMSTSQRVPEKLRNEFRSFGPCRDEFAATEGWPAQLYVREARRMVSDYVMTEHNCRGAATAKVSVGMAAYGMDSHNCQRIVQNGAARNEGDVQVHGLKPYPIAFDSIVPAADQCDNLIVPVCLSATHIAFGSIRMEPVFMVLGQSAAVAAAIAIDDETTVQKIDRKVLRQTLIGSGQVLERVGTDKPVAHWVGGSDDNWLNATNWSGGALPIAKAGVIINHPDSTAMLSRDFETNVGSLSVGYGLSQTGSFHLAEGSLTATAISSRKARIGYGGGSGEVRQTGGTLTVNSLQVGLDASSSGRYELSGGTVSLIREIDDTTGSLSIGDGNAEGRAEFLVSGGRLDSRSGVTLAQNDGHAVFALAAVANSDVQIGTSDGGFWKQHTGGTLRFIADTSHSPSIRVLRGQRHNGDVYFARNSQLHPEFKDAPLAGTWDVMHWDGKLVDEGLRLADEVDTRWSFSFIDTDNSGSPDTLRVEAKKSTTQPRKDVANAGYDPTVPPPTRVNVRYGDHTRHTLDFWKAESDQPTPLVFVIHGGGWRGGSSQQTLHKFVDTARLLNNGISVASIHYRLMKHAQDVQPPVKAPLEDAARALQFVRSKSADWNIDKTRIGAAGGSAGACSCLWIGYHNDLADPNSKNPIARESSRPNYLAVTRPQTTLDPAQMKEWIANSKYGAHAFKLDDFKSFLTARDNILPWIKEYSPYEQLSKDDPPTYMYFSVAPAENRVEKDPTHSAIFGVKLKERCDELGVPCEVVYPGAPNVQHKTPTDYLIDKLK